MHIVVDTNTVLSGLLWGGPPRHLIDLARARSLTLGTSLILLAELAEVIARDKFAHRVQLAGLSAAELVQDYRHLAHVVEPQPLPAPASRDPVLACALAARADLIVTRDFDLLDLNTYQNISIVNAAEALSRIQAQGSPVR